MSIEQNKIGLKVILFITIAFVSLGIVWQCALGEESISNLSQEQRGDDKEIQKKIKELEEKAKVYQQIIDIKQKQQMTLNNQISLIETEQKKIETEIEINKKIINETNERISDLIHQIYEKEEIMNSQRKILAELIQVYYKYRKQNEFNLLIDNNSFSGFLKEKDRIGQTGDKMRELISSINSIRNDLETQKQSLEQKRKDIATVYIEQKEKMTELDNVKDKKEMLVTQTRGEENRYADLLARVERQKMELLGDIDEIYSANAEEIERLLSTLEKPKSGLASTSWYFSQKDSRWGKMKIGQSNSLVKDYGCALTSVAMIFTFYGDYTTPANLAKKKIYYWDLIVWPGGDNVKLVKNTYHKGVSWRQIDAELNKNHPVIVFIRAKSDGAGHYVVIHHKSGNDYVVHDPYFGANIYLSSSIKLLSALYKTSISKNSIDQMVLYQKKDN